MKLYSYIVAVDTGFAPNPFFGYCTLGTCKPRLRRTAEVGDWVIGTGAKTRHDLAGHLIFAMRVDEVLDFHSYWLDPRFRHKRPKADGMAEERCGDNTYHRGEDGRWIQEPSFHSGPCGEQDDWHVEYDTAADRVLISQKFVYWGANALWIPDRFKPHAASGDQICMRAQGYRILRSSIVEDFVQWLEDEGRWGLQGLPLDFEAQDEDALPRCRRQERELQACR